MLNTIPSTLNNNALSLGSYANLDVWHDTDTQAVWWSMAVEPRPCFTWDLVRDIMRFQQTVHKQFDPEQIRYLVFASNSKDVFSFGGDLKLFRELIERQDAKQLTGYADDCVSILYNHHRSVGLPVTSIAVIEGDALGAGFESALASNVLIAERGTKMGFPETLFNLVPGHGAFNLLSRRVGTSMAKEMILGGKLYSAEELHQMGLIDVLVDIGAGRSAVDTYIRQHNKLWNAHYALQSIQATCQRMTRDELQQSAAIWVEAALKVRPAHLRVMDRLVRAQNRAITAREQTPIQHPVPAMMASAHA
jgi:DSF synthase